MKDRKNEVFGIDGPNMRIDHCPSDGEVIKEFLKAMWPLIAIVAAVVVLCLVMWFKAVHAHDDVLNKQYGGPKPRRVEFEQHRY